MSFSGAKAEPQAWRGETLPEELFLLNGCRSSITLIECVTNFLNWSGTTIPQALAAVTATPAAMLGLQGVKGTLDAGADADLVVLAEEKTGNWTNLVVDEVWKFGARVF